MAHGDHELGHEVRHADLDAFALEDHGLLFDDVDLGVDLDRIMRADLGTETILERRDDAAPVGVVLGVGRCEQHDVEW